LRVKAFRKAACSTLRGTPDTAIPGQVLRLRSEQDPRARGSSPPQKPGKSEAWFRRLRDEVAPYLPLLPGAEGSRCQHYVARREEHTRAPVWSGPQGYS